LGISYHTLQAHLRYRSAARGKTPEIESDSSPTAMPVCR
jgi:hypothetical protein